MTHAICGNCGSSFAQIRTDAGQADALPLPPHSIEAEQSILGAIMLDNTVLDRVNGNLASADFYADAHRAIYAHDWRSTTKGSR